MQHDPLFAAGVGGICACDSEATMSKAVLRTLPVSAPASDVLNGARWLGRIVAIYCNCFGRAARAGHEYELLTHQTDAELARRGLARSELPVMIRERFFS